MFALESVKATDSPRKSHGLHPMKKPSQVFIENKEIRVDDFSGSLPLRLYTF